MSRKASPLRIGLFVLGAIVLLVGAVAILGSGRLFTTSRTFVLFFEDDVRGLRVGAPVNLKGVRIGSVTDIAIRFDTDKREVSIPVYIELQLDRAEVTGTSGHSDVGELIERGLRAQLIVQSFVTGMLAIELDFLPDTPARIVSAESRYPEIPTVRSSISELRTTVNDLVAEFRKLPLPELSQRFIQAMANLDRAVLSLATLAENTNTMVSGVNENVTAALQPVPSMLRSIEQAAQDVSRLANNADAQVPILADRSTAAIEQLTATLKQAEAAIGSIQGSLGDGSQLQYQAVSALDEINAAAGAVRRLAEYLQENPNALVTGKPDWNAQ